MMPREKLLLDGPESLNDEELLAIFLRTGAPGVSVMELAGQLLADFEGLRGLMQAGKDDFLNCRGVGVAKYAQLISALEMSRRYLRSGIERGESISDPSITRQFLQLKLRHCAREIFACLFLDNQHRLIRYEEMFYGTIDGASVHPREVIRRALELNAAAIIFAHNHPSGVAEPSHADKRITERLSSALALVDIRVLDHLVVGDTEVVSFAELGLL
ncbi:MAG: DNA repair protein RadC [Gammaproteobacteria bacterium]|nr:DNA repair protein RadC [Gammaproteobacteria bacterium]MBT4494715.1 DNA repair protein RadC [Gammaproteobacteria bacterium]MBT7370910.1 DNA repair protein RadC [Gammaproteobacteria bacterium]